MKKTLFISLEFPPQIGGVANYLANLCQNLDNSKIIVLTNKHPESEKFDQQQKYKIIRKDLFSKIFWPKWLKLYFIAKKITKKEKIEQIIACQTLPVGTIAYLLKLPYLVATYAMDVTLLNNHPRKIKLAKKIYQKAQNIITISQYTKKELVKLGVSENKIKMIYPCPAIQSLEINKEKSEQFKKKYNPEGKKIILSCGRLVERKGQDMVIRAMKTVLEKIPNALYLIGGKGDYEKKLKNLVNSLELNDKIKFIGFVDEGDLPYLYNLCDVFAMPSRQLKNGDVEGFGMVFLEANLFNKPVVGGNSGGIPDAIIDGETGILVNPTSADDIARAIIKLLQDHALSQRLGQNGKKRALCDFNWQKQTNNFKNLL